MILEIRIELVQSEFHSICKIQGLINQNKHFPLEILPVINAINPNAVIPVYIQCEVIAFEILYNKDENKLANPKSILFKI